MLSQNIFKSIFGLKILFFFFFFFTDRERQSEYRLQVVASDTPDGGPEQKSTTIPVYIRLEDVNDTPPLFSQSQYSAVVPENSEIGTLVAQVVATDPDLGKKFAF